MLKTILLAIVLAFIFYGNALADKAESMDQAQELSRQTGKPILLEFVHED